MRQEVIEPRRNRINPRVIKRKMSKWPKKRKEHRNLPPLQKQFVEAVVSVRRKKPLFSIVTGLKAGDTRLSI
jgi:hypothetical protein